MRFIDSVSAKFDGMDAEPTDTYSESILALVKIDLLTKEMRKWIHGILQITISLKEG